ncbi:unnamed protein product [Owenia fusiformis]|uniref:Uncharacterized protein n=1 Tax=Owenia fusiformis TaxID=6347 RepID=A0A8J1XJ93_OWEFU|nr:unnamed protein product [Owenia fusiformis]
MGDGLPTYALHFDPTKYEILVDQIENIERVFKVRIELCKQFSEDQRWISFSLKITDTVRYGLIDKAKIYISSLTGEEEDEDTKTTTRMPRNYNTFEIKTIKENLDEIIRESQASIEFLGARVLINGSPDCCNRAVKKIEEILAPISPEKTQVGMAIQEHQHRGVDEGKDDSSYESENSRTSSRNNSDSVHDDVIRTSSDTLRAEYSDPDIDPLSKSDQGQGHTRSLPEGTYRTSIPLGSHNPTRLLTSTSSYDQLLEKSIKMGYSHHLFNQVWQKLGPNSHFNDVLKELIKTGPIGAVQSEQEESTSVLLSDTEYPTLKESMNMQPSKEFDHGLFSRGMSVSVPGEFETVYESISPKASLEDVSQLRHIVIDGSNVAMSHGNKEKFSCKGIEIAVNWFKARGHRDITVFVPKWRKEVARTDNPIINQEILHKLDQENILVYTPSRRIGGKRVVCYDDRYIIKLASECDGIVVSNDNYRDLQNEAPEYRKVIEERLLMYSFVNVNGESRFMPPDDPLGRHGPCLDNFLRKTPTIPEQRPPNCPYGKKCTYGNKCKYYHPERGNQPHRSVTERIASEAATNIKLAKEQKSRQAGDVPEIQLPDSESPSLKQTSRFNRLQPAKKTALMRTTSVIEQPVTSNRDLADSMKTMSLTDSDRERIIKEKAYNEKLKNISKQIDEQDKLPDHWSKVSENAPVPKKPLALTSGHLTLAKKLSDEGQSNESSGKQSPLGSGLTPRSSGSPQGKPQDGHAKLGRQLSLTGSEDPRLKKRQHHPQSRPMAPSPVYDEERHHSYPLDIHQVRPPTQVVRPIGRQLSTGTRPPVLGHHLGPFVTREMLPEHAQLTQMSSDPHAYGKAQPHAKQINPRMLRQNSTSDPQIAQMDDTKGMIPHSSYGLHQGVHSQARSSWPYAMDNKNIYNPQPPYTQGQGNIVYGAGGYNQYTGDYQQAQSYMSHPGNQPQVHQLTPQPQYGGVHYPGGLLPQEGHYSHVHNIPSTQQSHMFQHQQQQEPHILIQSSAKGPIGIGGATSSGSQMTQSQMPTLSYDESDDIKPTDTRYNTYLHLCGIFQEKDVRKVMNKYPHELDAKKICSYLISMNP